MPLSTEDLNAEVLAALGHPNRIRIVQSLRGRALCNCDLARELGLEQSNLSRHMKVLERAGIVTCHKQGLRVNFMVTDTSIFDILDLAAVIAKRAALLRAETVALHDLLPRHQSQQT